MEADEINHLRSVLERKDWSEPELGNWSSNLAPNAVQHALKLPVYYRIMKGLRKKIPKFPSDDDIEKLKEEQRPLHEGRIPPQVAQKMRSVVSPTPTITGPSANPPAKQSSNPSAKNLAKPSEKTPAVRSSYPLAESPAESSVSSSKISAEYGDGTPTNAFNVNDDLPSAEEIVVRERFAKMKKETDDLEAQIANFRRIKEQKIVEAERLRRREEIVARADADTAMISVPHPQGPTYWVHMSPARQDILKEIIERLEKHRVTGNRMRAVYQGCELANGMVPNFFGEESKRFIKDKNDLLGNHEKLYILMKTYASSILDSKPLTLGHPNPGDNPFDQIPHELRESQVSLRRPSNNEEEGTEGEQDKQTTTNGGKRKFDQHSQQEAKRKKSKGNPE